MNRYSSEEQKQIASTIVSQLGGFGRLSAMTGAKQFLVGENTDSEAYLIFKIGRNSKSVNYVKITLNAMDLYDTQYTRATIKGITTKSESSGIYADMLKTDFETATGMYLTL